MTVIDQALVDRLIDAAWYAARYTERDGRDPVAHYREVGARIGNDPNPMFSTRWYLERYPDVAASGLTALEDYVGHGAALGRDPGPLFSTRWYLATNPDVAAAGLNPLEHYLSWGPKQRRDPSPLFDSHWYFSHYPDAHTPDVDARVHYMGRGAALGYDPCPHFNTRWYLQQNPAVAASGENPLLHYVTAGADAGLDPSPEFSTLGYLVSQDEPLPPGENPLHHFLARRLARNRIPGSGAATTIDPAVLQQAQAVVAQLSPIEPDLAALPSDLDTIPLLPSGPDAAERLWRALYLSLFRVPRRIVLVGSIDGSDGPADPHTPAGDTLILETDTETPSLAEALPRGTEWRSLAEFGGLLPLHDRAKVLTALVHGMQPETLLVSGSQAGWEMLARHGAPLRGRTGLLATDLAPPGMTGAELLRDYFRACFPLLTALYAYDMTETRRLAALFGTLPAAMARIHPPPAPGTAWPAAPAPEAAA